MNFDILVWLLSRYGLTVLVRPNIPNAKKKGCHFMKILLIHQNFPGQYKHLGPALAARGDQVVALTPKVKSLRDGRVLMWFPMLFRVEMGKMGIHG